MPTPKRVGNTKRARTEVAQFLDLEAAVGEEEDYEDELQNSDEDFIEDGIEVGSSSRASSLAPSFAQNEASLDVGPILQNLRERAAKYHARHSPNEPLDSAFLQLGSVETYDAEVYMFKYLGPPMRLLERLESHQKAGTVFDYRVLPHFPTTYFVMCSGQVLADISERIYYPFLSPCRIPTETYSEIRLWSDRRFLLSVGTFVRIQSHSTYRGDLGVVVHHDCPEDSVVIACVPRIAAPNKRKRNTGPSRATQRLFDPKEFPRINPRIPMVLEFPYWHVGEYLYRDGLVYLPMPFKHLKAEDGPPLEEMLPLYRIPHLKSDIEGYIRKALKLTWSPGARVLVSGGQFTGAEGKVVSYPVDDRVTILLPDVVEPVLCSVDMLERLFRPGDKVRVTWGANKGLDGIISVVERGIATVVESSTNSIQVSVVCLEDLSLEFNQTANTKQPCDPHIGQFGLVVEGPYALCFGQVAALAERYVLLKTSNHEPQRICVLQKHVLLVDGSSYRAMDGSWFSKSYERIRLLLNKTCIQEILPQLPGATALEVDAHKLEKVTLDVPMERFTVEPKVTESSQVHKRSLLGEEAIVISGPHKGKRSTVKSYSSDTVVLYGIGEVKTDMNLKQGDVVLFQRTLTHSMDGKRLRDPLHLRDLTCQPERNASPGISDSDALPGGDFFPSGPASMVSLSGSTLPSGSAFDISPSDETSGGTETETNNIALAPTSRVAFMLDATFCKNIIGRFNCHVSFLDSFRGGRLIHRTGMVSDSLNLKDGPTDGPALIAADPGEVWVSFTENQVAECVAVHVNHLGVARPRSKKEKVMVLAGEYAGQLGIVLKNQTSKNLVTVKIGLDEGTCSPKIVLNTPEVIKITPVPSAIDQLD